MDGGAVVGPLHDFEAEQTVLGAALAEKAALDRAVSLLRKDDFSEQFHQSLFGAMAALHERGEPVNLLTVKAELRPDEIKQGGGNGYLAGLVSASVACDLEYVDYLARRVAGLHRRRRIAHLATEMQAAACTGGPSESEMIDRLERGLHEIAAPARLGGVIPSPYRWVDPSAIAPRQWLHGRHYIRKYLSATVAPSGVGKSSLVLLDAISMVAGRDLLSGKSIPCRSVWYLNLEDPIEELQRRIQAITLRYGLNADALGERLFLDSGRTQPFCIAREDKRSGVAVDHQMVKSVTSNIIERKIDVLILDPFVSTHAVSENDNGAIDLVAKTLAGIADAANCSVEVVHHVRKGNGTGEVTVEDARGASALIAAARSARVLNPMTQDEAAKSGIEPVARRAYFRIDNGKASMAPAGDQAAWRRLVSVGLDNGVGDYPEDSVGVVAAWSWPDAFAGVTADHLHEIQNKVAAGVWRADSQAAAWVGKPIAEAFNLDLDQRADKAKVKTLLKTWLKNGALVEVEKDDENRKARRFVEVGEWA